MDEAAEEEVNKAQLLEKMGAAMTRDDENEGKVRPFDVVFFLAKSAQRFLRAWRCLLIFRGFALISFMERAAHPREIPTCLAAARTPTHSAMPATRPRANAPRAMLPVAKSNT